MQPKLNFYDFVGYLIPGTIFLLNIYWIFAGFFITDISFNLKSIGDSFLFLVLSYLFGHIIQSYANKFEEKNIKENGSWESDHYLKPENEFYSKEFKNNLYSAIKDQFNIDIEKEVNNKKRVQEVFNLCYTLIVQENLSSQTDIFNGFYGLYRGLNIVKKVVLCSTLIITVKQLLYLMFNFNDVSFLSVQLSNYDPQLLVVGIMVSIFTYGVSSQLLSRCKRFSNRFSDSVYRNFYVWYFKEINKE